MPQWWSFTAPVFPVTYRSWLPKKKTRCQTLSVPWGKRLARLSMPCSRGCNWIQLSSECADVSEEIFNHGSRRSEEQVWSAWHPGCHDAPYTGKRYAQERIRVDSWAWGAQKSSLTEVSMGNTMLYHEINRRWGRYYVCRSKLQARIVSTSRRPQVWRHFSVLARTWRFGGHTLVHARLHHRWKRVSQTLDSFKKQREYTH